MATRGVNTLNELLKEPKSCSILMVRGSIAAALHHITMLYHDYSVFQSRNLESVINSDMREGTACT